MCDVNQYREDAFGRVNGRLLSEWTCAGINVRRRYTLASDSIDSEQARTALVLFNLSRKCLVRNLRTDARSSWDRNGPYRHMVHRKHPRAGYALGHALCEDYLHRPDHTACGHKIIAVHAIDGEKVRNCARMVRHSARRSTSRRTTIQSEREDQNCPNRLRFVNIGFDCHANGTVI